MKLSKIAVGWYANEDGTWAVIGDDPGEAVTKAHADGEYGYVGIGVGCSTQREWQVVHDPGGGLREDSDAGDRVAWVDTLREGRAYLNEATRVVTVHTIAFERSHGRKPPSSTGQWAFEINSKVEWFGGTYAAAKAAAQRSAFGRGVPVIYLLP